MGGGGGGRGKNSGARAKVAAYVSDGDINSDGDVPMRGPIPLRSLEHRNVRDFVAEMEHEHGQRMGHAGPTASKNKSKKAAHETKDKANTKGKGKPTASKRARAELEQIEQDRRKKQMREDRAAKVVWRKFDRGNAAFATYYQRVLAMQSDSSAWATFLQALQTPLSVHIRVNAQYPSLCEIVTGTLELDFNLQNVAVRHAANGNAGEIGQEGGAMAQVSLARVPWCPHALTWQLTLDAKSFRKAEALRDLQSYFHTQSQLGTIQRLDPLACITALLLDVQPGDRVLDLCGGGEQRAPVLAQGLAGRTRATSSSSSSSASASAAMPTQCGALVVNERDATRAARAVQTLSRTLALSRELLVTAHKPLEFPLPSTSTHVHASNDDEVSHTGTAGSGSGVFDRVLCSVPCSGDGLARSIPEKWRTWTPSTALHQHTSQLALASHAMQLVRVGGVLLYATRSLNPIENEAVVTALLRDGGGQGGSYELVDVSHVCDQVVRMPGLPTWEVMDDTLTLVPHWEDASVEQRKSLRASMWPPPSTQDWHLQRCVRLLPHHNDTNALFVAVIRKVCEPEQAVAAGPTVPYSMLPSEDKEPTKKKAKKKTMMIHEKQQQRAARKKVLGSLSPMEDAAVNQLRVFYGMSDANKQKKMTEDDALAHVMERSGFARDRGVHLISLGVSALLVNEYQAGRLAVHRAGVEAFKRVVRGSQSAFEITDDGARALLPLLSVSPSSLSSASRSRVLQLPMEEFTSLVTTREMWLKNASEATREALSGVSEGSLVVALDDMEPLQTADQDLVVVAVKRHNSYSLVSSQPAVARVKSLLKELANDGGDGDDDEGYDSFEFEEDA